MSASLVAVGEPDGGSLLAKLEAAVGVEFRGKLLRFAPDDPLFAGSICQVADCPYQARSHGICRSHYERWRREDKPDVAVFVAATGPIRQTVRAAKIGVFDLSGLRTQARLEVAYVLQVRRAEVERVGCLAPAAVRHLIGLLADAQAGSLLEHPAEWWVQTLVATRVAGSFHANAMVRYAHRQIRDLAEGTDAESEFARDTWRSTALGVAATRPGRQINFGPIGQPWLRVAGKRWARFRLAVGRTFATVRGNVDALSRFSRFLAEQHPEIAGPAGITRDVVVHYLSWIAATDLAAVTKNNQIVIVRGFLDSCHRHGFLAGLPAAAVIYTDDLPRLGLPLPRFIPEYVMAQLEDPANLARITDDTARHLLVVIMETGMRVSDACALPFDPIIVDSVGWPCLRFYNAKVSREQLVPLSAKAADTIRAQQAHLRGRWPDAPPQLLFPGTRRNPGGTRPYCYTTLQRRLVDWQQTIDLRDEAGQPVRVTPHQFRHTLGTRMINQGVPQHIIQKLLGHASPQMTARYATIHDTTVRAAFDAYQQRRVDITGRRLEFDPHEATSDAEWVKHNLARVAASLPNGYCGRPPQQDCPHPNACLTCPDFQTTPQFLPIHRRHRDDTLELLTAAGQAGNARLADNHRQVAGNLDRIIATLETLDEEPTDATG